MCADIHKYPKVNCREALRGSGTGLMTCMCVGR